MKSDRITSTNLEDTGRFAGHVASSPALHCILNESLQEDVHHQEGAGPKPGAARLCEAALCKQGAGADRTRGRWGTQGTWGTQGRRGGRGSERGTCAWKVPEKCYLLLLFLPLFQTILKGAYNDGNNKTTTSIALVCWLFPHGEGTRGVWEISDFVRIWVNYCNCAVLSLCPQRTGGIWELQFI